MSKVVIEINTDNAAFQDKGMVNQLQYILLRLIDRLNENHTEQRLLFDSNGNCVGSYCYYPDED